MISIGLSWLVASSTLLGLLILITQFEKKRGKRVALSRLRGWFDGVVATIGRRIVGTWRHFVRYIIQLGWYYGLHSFLQAVLKTLVRFYEGIELVFEENRRRAKQLRAERRKETQATPSHLTEMAQHKVDTALTPAQQRRLKDKELKGD